MVLTGGWTVTGRPATTGPTPWLITPAPPVNWAVRVVLSPAPMRLLAAVKLVMAGGGSSGWVMPPQRTARTRASAAGTGDSLRRTMENLNLISQINS